MCYSLRSKLISLDRCRRRSFTTRERGPDKCRILSDIRPLLCARFYVRTYLYIHTACKTKSPTGSHKDKVMGFTSLYAAPEVVSGFLTSNPGIFRPTMDTYSVGLVALQVLDLADLPRTSIFEVRRLNHDRSNKTRIVGAKVKIKVSYYCTKYLHRGTHV